MKEDYFFAPQDKISKDLRFIRICALLTAIFLSMGAVGVNFWASIGPNTFLFDPPPPPFTFGQRLILALATTVIQIFILIPCWRCWMLRRWACMTLLAGTRQVAAYAVLFNPQLALILIVFLLPLTRIIRQELPNLNSGF